MHCVCVTNGRESNKRRRRRITSDCPAVNRKKRSTRGVKSVKIHAAKFNSSKKGADGSCQQSFQSVNRIAAIRLPELRKFSSFNIFLVFFSEIQKQRVDKTSRFHSCVSSCIATAHDGLNPTLCATVVVVVASNPAAPRAPRTLSLSSSCWSPPPALPCPFFLFCGKQ